MAPRICSCTPVRVRARPHLVSDRRSPTTRDGQGRGAGVVSAPVVDLPPNQYATSRGVTMQQMPQFGPLMQSIMALKSFDKRRREYKRVGWIYAARNPSFVDPVFKIGQSKVSPAVRVHQLSSSTSVYRPFELVYWVHVSDRDRAEGHAHQLLQEHRVNPGTGVLRGVGGGGRKGSGPGCRVLSDPPWANGAIGVFGGLGWHRSRFGAHVAVPRIEPPSCSFRSASVAATARRRSRLRRQRVQAEPAGRPIRRSGQDLRGHRADQDGRSAQPRGTGRS
ncbi:GIY-YIG nuclease family protein [Candidatus Palauibacter sp.]|uniref:GIY-YIG nuclease family protein n=1 Tax=Candidatus Palauibacter sp. TaxID=3101350 RepID=UPI003AF23EE1